MDRCREVIARCEKAMAGADFWNDQAAAQSVIQELKRARLAVEPFVVQERALEDARVLFELAVDEADAESLAEVETATQALARDVEALELRSLLSGPDDHLGAIVELHAGAGGTESQDWAAMLQRMLQRFAEQRGFTTKLLDLTPGEEAGLKSVAFEVEGDFAFGYLKGESGVHRLVRISPFDAQSRRHTSFASVFVSPKIDETIEVEIRDEDVRVDTYRASGAGGQHVNKTSSAVRLTHAPTGIVVQCQNERSQHRNREKAYEMLRSRLHMLEVQKEQERLQQIEATKMDNAFGSQIRSYVFHPYSLVKDHRTEVSTGNTTAVMDGDLDQFVDAYLRRHASRATRRA